MLVAIVAAAVLAGCTQHIAGTPVAGPGPAAAADGSEIGSAPSATLGPRGGLASDVLADECLLDRDRIAALVGRPVLEPTQREVLREDGSVSSSCYADSTDAYPVPVAAVNVYRPRTGTAAQYVATAPLGGRRDLPDLGAAAAVFDTATGPTVQVAGEDYLVTIAVLEGAPDEQAWRVAAQVALDALPP